MKISVSMIALDEEKNIGRALASCSFADEIVVVDGGSKDRTAEILERDPRVVLLRRPWGGHFGEQRQVSLERCAGDWVIRLDADEAFSAEFEGGIRAFLESLPPDVAACTVRQCNLIGGEAFYAQAYDGNESAPRIWRNRPEVRWAGAIHERPAGIAGKIAPIDVYVVHYGFLDKKRFSAKGSFYAALSGSGCEQAEELLYRDYNIQPRPPRSAVGSHVPAYAEETGRARSGRARLAIVRGPNLNPWEMQNYEPLAAEFDLTAYTTTTPNFDISRVTLPVVKVPSDPEHPGYMTGLEYALFDEDLIYSADTTWLFSYQASVIREKFGKKLVCLQWENIPFAYEESKEMRDQKAAVRKRADHFVATTERAREALVLEGVDPGRITVIPMGIDTEWFRPDETLRASCRKRLGIDSAERVVLFTGRMVWEKGVYDFVHSARLALGSTGSAPVRYLMVGKGVERDAVMARARDVEMTDSFLFVESHPYDAMRDLYNAADVFVLPSISTRMWKEQFGMVLAEAMACGTPVISTTSGSIPEVVGDAGLLVPANDPGDLGRAIAAVCRDESLRRNLRDRGRKRAVALYDSRKVAQQLSRVFTSVLSGDAPHKLAPAAPARMSASRETRPPAHRGPGSDGAAAEEPSRPDGRKQTRSAAVDDAYFRQERSDVLALVPVDASRVLDVGCGEGVLGKRLLASGASEVVGIEAEPAVAARARRNLSSVLEGDVETMALPFGEGHFDCIILADVLEHLRDPWAVLTRLRTYLADTGAIVASIPNVRFLDVVGRLADGRWEYAKFGILDRKHLRFFTRTEMEKLFEDAGFAIEGIAENLSPLHVSVAPGHSGDLSYGRVTFRDQSPAEVRDLFVFQYLFRARKTESLASARDRRVEAALADGDVEAARTALEEYLEEHPLDAEALLRHSDICAQLGRTDEALDDLGKILLFEPERPDARARKARIESALGAGG
jgi:glycosyltransferase involved in cell wall biosynthesis/2-polyprenyl-3-methyl-5-hydroxy-6-metoxy-1,4-benzoquinol methylase